MGKLVFGPGGSYHRPDHPHEFPPGLQAATHYLKAVQEVAPRVRRKLSDEVLGKHTFPRHFPGWQGLELTRDQIALDPIPGRPVEPQQTRFDEALPFLRAFQAWANEYYMWSPFVLDLLYRTLELWHRIDREIAELQGSIREAEEYEKLRPLTKEDQQVLESDKARLEFLEGEREKGWGWWVDFLTSEITIPQLDAWLAGHGLCPPSVPGTQLLNMPSSPSKATLWIFERLKRYASKTQGVSSLSERQQQLLKRWDRLHIEIGWEPPPSAPFFHVELILGGWQPEVETWKAARARFQDHFDQALENYRRACEERLKSGHLDTKPKDWHSQTNKNEKVVWGEPHRWEPVRTKYGADHFRWLALRQVKGLTPQQIVNLRSVEAQISAIHDGIEDAAALLEMELREVKTGPTPDLD